MYAKALSCNGGRQFARSQPGKKSNAQIERLTFYQGY